MPKYKIEIDISASGLYLSTVFIKKHWYSGWAVVMNGVYTTPISGEIENWVKVYNVPPKRVLFSKNIQQATLKDERFKNLFLLHQQSLKNT